MHDMVLGVQRVSGPCIQQGPSRVNTKGSDVLSNKMP